MPPKGLRGATPEQVARYREIGERFLNEVGIAIGMSGLPEAEVMRRAGYNKSYLTNLRSSTKHGYLPSLRVISDIEAALNVTFAVTSVGDIEKPRTVCRNGLHDLTKPGSMDKNGRCAECRRIGKRRRHAERRDGSREREPVA